MTIYRHGHKLTDKGSGVMVLLADGTKHFVIGARMPDIKDYRAQDLIIEAASRPAKENH